MGAKNHVIVMPDANVDSTLNALVATGFGVVGQRCMALSTVGIKASFAGDLNFYSTMISTKPSSSALFAVRLDSSQGLTVSANKSEDLSLVARVTRVDSSTIYCLDFNDVVLRGSSCSQLCGHQHSHVLQPNHCSVCWNCLQLHRSCTLSYYIWSKCAWHYLEYGFH
ncbi:hypothetical protein JHK87_043171 [Glycine soja]|nr:hypothetical protein JHK87_043171 [Glycine soja]